ncbi:hypothetical protein HGB07_06955 [Candidatus Roizmanbacteria bacterium]|nr:hypothetical protein [Candidatus Roizmanbacteria bacterium]
MTDPLSPQPNQLVRIGIIVFILFILFDLYLFAVAVKQKKTSSISTTPTTQIVPTVEKVTPTLGANPNGSDMQKVLDDTNATSIAQELQNINKQIDELQKSK